MKYSLLLILGLIYSSAFGQTKEAFALYGEGVRAYYDTDFDLAIQKYSEAIKHSDNFLAAYFNRAKAYYSKRAFEEARLDFSKVIELDNEYADAYFYLGEIEMKDKLYENAMVSYQKALEINPLHDKALKGIGLILYYERNYDAALKYFAKSIEVKPSADTYYQRSLVYFYTSDYRAAIKDLTEVLELNDKHAVALAQRGLCWQRSNFIDKACEDWKALKQLDERRALEYLSKYCAE